MQKVLDALPESHDHTAEVQAEEKSQKTVSENLSQEDEVEKGEELLWEDHESMNMNDQSIIPERKVTVGSKAGTPKPPPESEP